MKVILYKDLFDLAKITTSARDVTIDEGTILLLLDICVQKIYQKFELLVRDDIHFTVTDQVSYKLPEDCIKVLSFKDKEGVELEVNGKSSYIRYTSNLSVDLLFPESGKEVYIVYLASPPAMSCEDESVAFSIQYLEPFMTYLNYILHRMIGFKDLESLRIIKQDWLDSVDELETQGLMANPFRSNHDENFSLNRFR